MSKEPVIPSFRALVPQPAGGAPLPLHLSMPQAPKRPDTRGAMILGLGSMLLFIGTFVAWATTAPIASAAIAPGAIKVESNRKTIQHLEGGIIREILVKDGDRVKKGQVLLRLDDLQSSTQVEVLRSTRWALLAQDSRIEAEMADASELVFPADLLAARSDPRAADAIAGQSSLFAVRRSSLQSQVRVLELRVEQLVQNRQAAIAQVASIKSQLTFLRQEMSGVKYLIDRGLERLPRLLGLQRAEAQLIGNQLDTEASIERFTQQIAETRAQMTVTIGERKREVSTEQRDVRNRLVDAEEKLRSANDVATRRDIVAPLDGTVLNLRLFTTGGVVRPGEPVLDIVPGEDRMIAEVQVQVADIDVVHVGLEAEVRLPAFKQRLVPVLEGHVIFVSSDVMVDERTRATYYRAQIEINEEQWRAIALENKLELVPGMPVEAMILASERTFLSYIVQPIKDSFHRAFREQ